MKTATKSCTATQLVKDALEKVEEYRDYNIFTQVFPEEALKKAEEIDRKIKKGEPAGRLAGVPYALKDNFLSPLGSTTASSKILEPFKSPITATSVERLEAEGAICIGRTNLDAFAHGSSTENSYFGPTKNSADPERVAGGSSGGSAVAVALDIVQFATGTDTGGSIRQPASLNGVYGFKPTYGTISRYGVVAMASSTDCIGFFAKSPADMDLLMQVCAGQDSKDMTTLPDYYPKKAKMNNNTRHKVGIIKDFDNDSIDPAIRQALHKAIGELKKKGHEIVELEMPTLKYALAVYYIVVPAEISSNLSRYDGIRYGFRAGVEYDPIVTPAEEKTNAGAQDANIKAWSTDAGVRGSSEARDNVRPKGLADVYDFSRNLGFMSENKRRIMIGNFVLSSGFYDAYYLKAQKVRRLIIDEYMEAFRKCDFILTPVSPSPAFRLGEKINDPVAMYLEDVLTVPLNLAGVPGLAIPVGTTADFASESRKDDKMPLPVGLQLIGARRSDAELLKFAEEIILA